MDQTSKLASHWLAHLHALDAAWHGAIHAWKAALWDRAATLRKCEALRAPVATELACSTFQHALRVALAAWLAAFAACLAGEAALHVAKSAACLAALRRANDVGAADFEATALHATCHTAWAVVEITMKAWASDEAAAWWASIATSSATRSALEPAA